MFYLFLLVYDVPGAVEILTLLIDNLRLLESAILGRLLNLRIFLCMHFVLQCKIDDEESKTTLQNHKNS